MGWGASTECNRKGPDYFGLFASEVAELLSQDGDFLPFSEQIFEKCEVNSAVEEKNSSMSTYNAKEFRYTDSGSHIFHMSVAIMHKDSEREDLNIVPSGGMSSDDVQKVEGEQVNRSLAKMDKDELGSNVGAAPEDTDVHNDLQFLLKNDSAKVESVMKKHCDELLDMLGYMEEKLEELLDIVMSNCRRSMT